MTKPRLLHRSWLVLSLILVLAGVVRSYELGRSSFWYDEVVTVKLARTPNPWQLHQLLQKIDATRAPLHPLILQQWLRLFGPSEVSARSLSVVFGLLTIVLIYRLGSTIFDNQEVGLWAAYLAAISPPLIVYSREARMYAWLVLLTCLAWDTLFRLGLGATQNRGRLVLLIVIQVVLILSHPLGLLMMIPLGVASTYLLPDRKSWLLVFGTTAGLASLWIGAYFDHPPESTVGRLPFQFLLGTPIGFLGGNFLTLTGFASLIALGFIGSVSQKPTFPLEKPAIFGSLLLWFATPPCLLYLYSLISHPIFGPARYTLYVGPAYLLLVAQGVVRTADLASTWLSTKQSQWGVDRIAVPTEYRFGIRIVMGLAISGLAVSVWPTLIFNHDLKADWRSAAESLKVADPAELEPLLVVATENSPNVEVETARYYVGNVRAIASFSTHFEPARSERVWIAIGRRSGREIGRLPVSVRQSSRLLEFDGLRLYRVPASGFTH